MDLGCDQFPVLFHHRFVLSGKSARRRGRGGTHWRNRRRASKWEVEVNPEGTVVRDSNPVIMTFSAPTNYLWLAMRVYQDMVYPTYS
jgi:hypothetical protein